MINKSIMVSIIMVILGIIVFVVSMGYTVGESWMVEPGFFPLVVSILIIFFSIIVIINEYKKDKYIVHKFGCKQVKQYFQKNIKVIAAMLCSIVYVSIMTLIGFAISTFLFILSLILISEPKRKFLPRVIVTSLILTIAVFFFFEKIFNARLPMGTIFN